ncbi:MULTISPECIES: hypothetical protein [unclassified Leptospira]|uniref:hypothetical protein n=1 Tax=unclassified Leptospira TaxID=2633828 RepID=UPI0002BF7B48|nr:MULTISPECIES: hypothetical protein [unclassified Leptospira]EMJ97437.1 hypothetical protein LEP1GSC192_3555 [Leptospira sp. B5-022]MCR1793273.1 hypothetical protein [Leptospira sp. id769339]
MSKFAIFGLGYTGLRILNTLQKDNTVLGVSRETKVEGSILLDLSDPAALENFRKENEGSGFDASLITFPVQKLANRDQVFDTIFSISKTVWMFGSTSIYQRFSPDITEKTPLDPTHDRYETELRFLERGGRILRLSGIYGPDRNPANWARKGSVKKTKRQLNLIHGDDISEAVRLLLSYSGNDLPSELILTDGQWHTWLEIFRFLEDHGKIQVVPEEKMDREDCFIDSGLIRKFLPGLQTKDFWGELEKLEELT